MHRKINKKGLKMHEYDFDEMARHFNAMRKSYMDYRRGGSQSSIDKKINKYLIISELFFKKYPNPFSERDPEYIAPAKEIGGARTNHKNLLKKLNQYKDLRKNIMIKITDFREKGRGDDVVYRFENYMLECDNKIKKTVKEIELIEVSNLPI